MKIVVYLAFVCAFSFGCGATAEQQYRTHRVSQGETIYSISQKYNISEEDLYRLNPDARTGISVNAVIILPETAVDTKDFKKHRVKRRETLFSISQLYNISITDIKKYNKELYSRELKKGEVILIPLREKDPIVTTEDGSVINNGVASTGTHKVLPQETKYGIARKYGLSVSELESLNPGLGDSLPVGYVLNVPEKAVIEASATPEEGFEFYEVQAKEGFYRLKVKLGLTEEEIVALNPYAKDGLKEGMVLKIPSDKDMEEDILRLDLTDAIRYRTTKRLAIMLPFQLNRMDADSLQNNVDLIRENGALRVAIDFYSGVLMAAEFAKDHGISVHLDVYDTEGSESKVSHIISSNDFKEVDAVIGPLLRKNVEKAAAELRDTDTPVFSPLSNKDVRIYSNLFQTLPTEEMMEEAMLDYLRKNGMGKNILIVYDNKHQEQKEKLLDVFPNARSITPKDKGFIYAADIAGKLSENNENWVILESNDPVIVSNVVGLLNGMPAERNLRLFTLDKNDAYDYDDISNVHLANLKFTFPSVNKSYNFKDKNAFLISYKNQYGVFPNRYAVRGFDITYDVLLRLATAEDLYEANNSRLETEYIENKFRYSKKLFSGYQNQALYIIKYNDNLEFEVVQ